MGAGPTGAQLLAGPTYLAVLFNFESGADFLAELDRVYNITDGVLRSLIIKKEA